MKIFTSNYIRNFSLVLFSFLIYCSCDTEYVDELYPYSEITSFYIDMDSIELHGALSGETIFLYTSALQSLPDSVTPEIMISENATISPSSMEKVPLQDGVTYTVTAQDGSTTVYTLNVMPLQVDLTLEKINVSTAEYGQPRYVVGSGYLLNKPMNEVYLVSVKDGKETPVIIDAVNESNADGFGESIYFTLPEEGTTPLDTGFHLLKIVSGEKEIISDSAILYVEFTSPSFDEITETITATRGETLTLTGSYFGENRNQAVPVVDAKAYPTYDDYRNDTNGVLLEYVSHTDNSVTYNIPEEATLGDYYAFRINLYDSRNDKTGAYRIRSTEAPLLIIENN